MHLVDGDDAGDVDETGDAAYPRPYDQAVVHAAEQRDEGARGGDDEGVIEQGLGDGGHAARCLGKRQQVGVAGEPVGPLVAGIAKLPGARGAEGKTGRQGRRGDQGLGDGLNQLGRKAFQGPGEPARSVRRRGPGTASWARR